MKQWLTRECEIDASHPSLSAAANITVSVETMYQEWAHVCERDICRFLLQYVLAPVTRSILVSISTNLKDFCDVVAWWRPFLCEHFSRVRIMRQELQDDPTPPPSEDGSVAPVIPEGKLSLAEILAMYTKKSDGLTQIPTIATSVTQKTPDEDTQSLKDELIAAIAQISLQWQRWFTYYLISVTMGPPILSDTVLTFSGNVRVSSSDVNEFAKLRIRETVAADAASAHVQVCFVFAYLSLSSPHFDCSDACTEIVT